MNMDGDCDGIRVGHGVYYFIKDDHYEATIGKMEGGRLSGFNISKMGTTTDEECQLGQKTWLSIFEFAQGKPMLATRSMYSDADKEHASGAMENHIKENGNAIK